ncbi:hypothetical protein [Roseimaritima multifibrata]|uniref:hypothetical protein n=1 Tax=Roseimaritima multifibrata TaxID=1930274 RepID=UPI0011A7E539|nr:hypothetical protein [Roseimaritima multifibrata]
MSSLFQRFKEISILSNVRKVSASTTRTDTYTNHPLTTYTTAWQSCGRSQGKPFGRQENKLQPNLETVTKK